ncbi:MAG: 23S rRNA (adenine(2503)-C(2))-methyltransferase RlmN, partial [Candidatus Binataceae bacterium]
MGDAPATERADIRGLSLDELTEAITAAGQPPYRARQVLHWLHAKHAESFDAMHELPREFRAWLATKFTIGSVETASVARSADRTRKLLLRLRDGEAIETVIIPAAGRVTLCLSAQAGCAMACEFCATARMGLHRNLTAAEI